MKERNVVLILVMVLAVTCAVQAQVITSVVRANGASAGQPLPTEEGGLKDGNLVFSDRTYDWGATDTGTLGSLNTPIIGSEYIRTYNDDKNSGGVNVTYTVTTSTLATVWVTVDDRIDGGNGQARADAITAAIGAAGTFTDTGLQLHVHGDSTDPGRPLSVYAADLPPGDHVFGASQGSNFYVIGAVPADPTFNPPPVVDAGPDQVIWMTEEAQLDGVVSDAGPSDGTSPGSPGGVESFYWIQESGDGTAVFSATDILDPTVTFDAGGTYELMLQATDGLKDGNDIVTILVRDPADKAILAHWDMENIVDSNVPESIAGNHGTYVINQARDPGTPEVVDGIIGDDAIRFSLNDGHMLNPFVLPKVFGTLSHWCKLTTTARGAIYFESDESANGWGGPALEIHSGTRDGKWMFSYCDNASENNREIDGGNAVVGVWSHVVATWNIYGDVTLYVDGVAVDSDVVGDAGGGNIAPTEGNVVVGVISNFESGRRYNGDVDEIQVFNWDMSAEEIRALTALGDVPPQVDAGDDKVRQLQPGEKITLPDATVVDYGAPSETTIEWTTDSGPLASNAIFTDAGVVAAEVEFPDFGVYVLRLTADDGTFVASDTVQIEVVSPTCADVISEGLLMPGDISGPDGTPDCRVDIYDFAAFAADFLRCVDPQGDCEDPWNGG